MHTASLLSHHPLCCTAEIYVKVGGLHKLRQLLRHTFTCNSNPWPDGEEMGIKRGDIDTLRSVMQMEGGITAYLKVRTRHMQKVRLLFALVCVFTKSMNTPADLATRALQPLFAMLQ